MRDFADRLETSGFVLVSDILPSDEIAVLQRLFENADVDRVERSGQTYGARNLLSLPDVRRVAAAETLAHYLTPLLGTDCKAVRSIFFDKTEGANWPVLWHQDLSLAVKERRDLPGWTGWSVKRGVEHVQAPRAVLERMVTVRLHLDPCPTENGALRVIPGSHAKGQLSRAEIQAAVAAQDAQTISAAAGDGLFMRPLILHGSSPAQTPRHRRVLHLEFAPADLLPPELAWAC